MESLVLRRLICVHAKKTFLGPECFKNKNRKSKYESIGFFYVLLNSRRIQSIVALNAFLRSIFFNILNVLSRKFGRLSYEKRYFKSIISTHNYYLIIFILFKTDPGRRRRRVDIIADRVIV